MGAAIGAGAASGGRMLCGAFGVVGGVLGVTTGGKLGVAGGRFGVGAP